MWLLASGGGAGAKLLCICPCDAHLLGHSILSHWLSHFRLPHFQGSQCPCDPQPFCQPQWKQGVRCRGRAMVWGEMRGSRRKLPQQQSLNLAAWVSFTNPADKSQCTFLCVIARLSEGTGYLRTWFHRGVILSRVVWDPGFTHENAINLICLLYVDNLCLHDSLVPGKIPLSTQSECRTRVPLVSFKCCRSNEKTC